MHRQLLVNRHESALKGKFHVTNCHYHFLDKGFALAATRQEFVEGQGYNSALGNTICKDLPKGAVNKIISEASVGYCALNTRRARG